MGVLTWTNSHVLLTRKLLVGQRFNRLLQGTTDMDRQGADFRRGDMHHMRLRALQ